MCVCVIYVTIAMGMALIGWPIKNPLKHTRVLVC